MACGKTIYTDRQTAVAAINGKNGASGKGKKWAAKTYFCDECKGWHIFTQGKKRLKKQPETTHDLKTHPDHHGKQKGHGVLHIANFSSKKFG